MANIHILGTDLIGGSTLSGGSWSGSLPRDNIKNPQPSKIARTTDALAASTKLIADIGRVAPVSTFALVNHNGSAAGTVRFRLSTDPALGSPTIDVTVPALAPTVVWGSQPWGGFPWGGVDDTDRPPGGWTTFYKHPTSQIGRYIGVDIDDTGNLAGYLQAGVLRAGEAFVPAVNMSPGVAVALVDPSQQSRTIGGQRYTDVKPIYRTLSASFGWLDQVEAMGAVYDLQRLRGISGGILVVYDPNDEDSVLVRRTIYGTLTALSPITTGPYVSGREYSTTVEIEELI